MNWIKAPRLRVKRSRSRGRGRPVRPVLECPSGVSLPVALKVAGWLAAGAVLVATGHAAATSHRAEVTSAPVAVSAAIVQPLPPPYEWTGPGPVVCGRDIDCSHLVQPPKGGKGAAPSVTRRESISQGKGGRTVTESTTVRTANGSTTVTVRRGPNGSTVTRSVTSR
jgi:hypothetical protein